MVVAGEVEAKNFVLYIGHLGRRELSGATDYLKERRVTLLKRIISVMAIMAIMVAMVVASAMPVFAKGPPPCKGSANLVQVNPGTLGDANNNGRVCQSKKDGSFVDDRG